jgi:hypothetical protein
MKNTLLVAIVAVAIAGGGVVAWRSCSSENREPADCQLCTRPIHRETAFSIAVDSRRVWACCPRCGLSIVRDAGDRPTRAHATDYATGRLVPAEACVYVEGADAMPCCSPNVIVGDEKFPTAKCYDRCFPSVIAFEKAADAADYAAHHGGTIVSFETLLREIKKS